MSKNTKLEILKLEKENAKLAKKVSRELAKTLNGEYKWWLKTQKN